MPVDFRADLYALGVVLYEMVTGQTPFTHQNPAMLLMQQLTSPPLSPTRLNAEVDEALEQLILQLPAKEPVERPASAEFVDQRLAELTAEPGPALIPTPSPETAVGAGHPDLIPRIPLIGRETELKQLASRIFLHRRRLCHALLSTYAVVSEFHIGGELFAFQDSQYL